MRRGERRPVPDYDGRGAEREGGELALWIPRLLLAPPYLVSEYVVRRPLGWIATVAERERWPIRVIDFFTFGPDRRGGIFPTALFDFGLRPSVGLYFFWHDLGVPGNDLSMRAAFGGDNFWLASIVDRLAIGSSADVALALRHLSRSDNIFHGIGGSQADSPRDSRGRFAQDTWEARLELDARGWRSSRALLQGGVRRIESDGSETCCNDPSLDQQVQAMVYPAPPGINQRYSSGYANLTLALDSRLPRPMKETDRHELPGASTGIRLAVRTEFAERLSAQRRSDDPALAERWLRYGALLGAFLDVDGYERRLGLLTMVEYVDALGSGDVPFTEQVTLGGSRPMPGFLDRRLIDRGAVVARLEYRWPVWVWLDGKLMYEAGNVFPERFRGLKVSALRSSIAFGFESVGELQSGLQALVALGTRPYENGGGIDSVRLVVGTPVELE